MVELDLSKEEMDVLKKYDPIKCELRSRNEFIVFEYLYGKTIHVNTELFFKHEKVWIGKGETTFASIGKQMGISSCRVRQLFKSSIKLNSLEQLDNMYYRELKAKSYID